MGTCEGEPIDVRDEGGERREDERSGGGKESVTIEDESEGDQGEIDPCAQIPSARVPTA